MKANAIAMSARVLGAAVTLMTLGVLASCSQATSGTPPLAAAKHSYIVEAASTDAAAKAVADAGGEVTSRLNVIDAVEASLTDTQHAKVLETAGVKQITTNTIVTTLAAAYVRDSFESSSFAKTPLASARMFTAKPHEPSENGPAGRQPFMR